MNSIEFMTTRANRGRRSHLERLGVANTGLPLSGGSRRRHNDRRVGAGMEVCGKWETRLSRILPILAMVLLSLGMFSLYLDLEIKGLKLNVIRLYLTFRPTAVISWGAWILLVTYPSLALWFLGSISGDSLSPFCRRSIASCASLIRVREWAARVRRRILVLNMILGTCLGIYTGIFLSGMVARPVWHSGVLGPLFLISGISTGAALLALFKVNHDLAKAFIKWDMAALIAESVFLALFLLDNATGTEAHRAAAALFLSGPYTGAFFGLVVVAGILAPLVIGWADLTEEAKAPLLAPVLGLIGGLALRFIIVFAGQALS